LDALEQLRGAEAGARKRRERDRGGRRGTASMQRHSARGRMTPARTDVAVSLIPRVSAVDAAGRGPRVLEISPATRRAHFQPPGRCVAGESRTAASWRGAAAILDTRRASGAAFGRE